MRETIPDLTSATTRPAASTAHQSSDRRIRAPPVHQKKEKGTGKRVPHAYKGLRSAANCYPATSDPARRHERSAMRGPGPDNRRSGSRPSVSQPVIVIDTRADVKD